MIIVRTPLRISLAGGGSDFRGFYQRTEGCVLSAAIDKCVYTCAKRRFDDKIRVGYSVTEFADDIDEIQHELFREAMRMTGVRKGVEMATMADIPTRGSGLGSSSTVTVGSLHALYTYKGELVSADRLAGEACEIEIGVLGKPIGKQDQYIAAFGGLRFISFLADETVTVEPVNVTLETRRALSENLMLFYTGVTRKADDVLQEQKSKIGDTYDHIKAIRDQAYALRDYLERGEVNAVGRILYEAWERKKLLASGISNPEIDALYERALNAGAIGGKITGAGGGGFLLLYCRAADQPAVRKALEDLQELPFDIDDGGSRVVYNGQR